MKSPFQGVGLQITKQVDKAVIDLRSAPRDELMMVAEALLKVSQVFALHGMTMTVHPVSKSSRLDFSTRSQ